MRIKNKFWIGQEAERLVISVETIGKSGINGRPFDDEAFTDDGVYYHSALDEYRFEDLHPMELTPGVLLKCGFLWLKNNTPEENEFFQHPRLPLHVVRAPSGFMVESKAGHLLSTLTFVHQLQNLYFDLTGEELVISL